MRRGRNALVSQLRLIHIRDMKPSTLWTAAIFLTTALVTPTLADAHCQIPCGIYDDHARVHALREDIQTIRKAVTNIQQLAAKKNAQNQNQLVRWIMNKEAHAERIIRTVSDYFLTQKIKPNSPNYVEILRAHHAVMVAAMKCKQKASMDAVNELTDAVNVIEPYWPRKR